MTPLPEKILQHAVEDLLSTRHLAYLEVDSEGCLLQCGGALAEHHLLSLERGHKVEDALPFLLGLLPCPEDKIVLRAVQTDSGACLDVHVLSDQNTGTSWIVLLDARSEHDTKQVMQQKGNELSLRSERQAQVLDAHLGRSVAQLLLDGTWPIRSSGERRQATILFSDIRDFTPFSERSTPEAVFRTLNQYIPAMIDPIVANGGIVDKIAGDAVMAVFGLLSPQESAPHSARLAAMQIIRNVTLLNQTRKSDGEPCLEIGIGITTGPVAVGLIGTLERRGFAAIGHHVNFASRLQGQARPGELLVDEETCRLLGQEAKEFTQRTLQLKGFREPVPAYGLVPKTDDSAEH